MRGRTALFGALGTASTLFGLAVLFVPDAVRSVGPLASALELVGSVDSTGLMLVAGLLVASYVGLFARSRPGPERVSTRTDADRRFETAGTSPPEAVTTGTRQVTAAGLDADIDAAVEHGGVDLLQVRGELATLATGLYAEAAGVSTDAAQEAVQTGAWTRDDVAAAFLSVEDDVSVRARVALWLRPKRERRRRLERTIAAIERLQGEP